MTGHAGGPPLGAPAGLVPLVHRAHRRLMETTRGWADGRERLTELDAMALLGERAALAGLERRGTRSCGGSTRLLRTLDGWIAVALPRPDDLALVPAWLGMPLDRWPTDPGRFGDLDAERLAAHVGRRPVGELVERAALVGLAAGRLDEVQGIVDPVHVAVHRAGRAIGRPPVVVDLSSLWAGPLCSHLLERAGARVVKVESVRRPDGMRGDPSGLFDLLTAGKRSVALDLAEPSGVRRLRSLIEAADVVIEASRPRALRQMGLVAEEVVAVDRPTVWLSITAHGRAGEAGMRVGFGDDAAVAGGLVAWDGAGTPCFLADAVADPLTGLVSAAAIAGAIAAGGSWLLDVALSRVAAAAALGITHPAVALDDRDVARPRARPASGTAPALGADTEEVLAELAHRR